MGTIEEIELDRYHQELEHDVEHIVAKYCRIMSWDVPELDETAARQLIFEAMEAALNKVKQR